MNNIFVIADLHLGHKKIAALRGFNSIEEHDNAIIAAWNSVITKRDVIYVLGDVFRLDNIPKLLGIKKLALGNHDHKNIIQYTKLFNTVHAGFLYDSCLLTHIPVHPNQLSRYELNIHGHTHSYKVDDNRYIPTSVEHCKDMKPMLLNELINKRRKDRETS